MVQQIDPALKDKLLSTEFRAAITLWNRLEGRPRQVDFDRSLRAEVRDPLWMLTRQWQFGEFKGEDAGSAVKARVQLNTSRIDRFAVKDENRDASGGEQFQPAVPYDQTLPLEIGVEREPVLPVGPEPNTADLALRSQMGRHWLRLLKQAGLASVKPAVLKRFGFDDISTRKKEDLNSDELLELAHLQSDPLAWQSLRAVSGRLPDGRKLLVAIDSPDFDDWVDSSGLSPVLKHLAKDFRSWFDRLFSQPQKTELEDAWAPSYLEYQFAVSAPDDASGEKRTLLTAEEYYHGTLDWFAFDVDSQRRLQDDPEAEFPESSFVERPPFAFLPTQIEFNGMPNVRWWEFEDRRTDFGSIRATTGDVPLLLLAEFGLIYGNDWTVVPYNLEVGSLADIKGIIVSDVFGVQTLIRPAGQGQRMDWQQWSMYNLARGDRVDTRLFLPPSVAKVYESAPLERIVLARDEVANLVWGVEETVPGIAGNGVNGFEAGKMLSSYFAANEPEPAATRVPNEAKIQYVLGTTVPENWIPFIATHQPGSNRQIRLQRGSMQRVTDVIPGSVITPRGQILRVGLDPKQPLEPKQPYFVHEEEVPRSGVIVTRKYQRARGPNGEVFTWIGRRKETGRGEGASGLVFDQVVPLDQPETP
ncbi:MAG TPA: hypothetical protein VFT08_10805 [Pyrinomonadaceae bacterium]|nr:hypothetical protein [Pyrinomonadaceae bacterium]